MNPTILIAPNAFKHSLEAGRVAQAIGEGLMESKLDASIRYFPIGDGGDGTIDLIIDHVGAIRKSQIVRGPLGEPIVAGYGLSVDGKTAFIEMANASGTKLLNTENRNPLKASSYGTGELMLDALNEGAEHFIIGMGGSATVDGGCGILAALGVQFYDKFGNELSAHPAQLIHATEVDLSGLDERLNKATTIILCDVANKLLGASGAAAVFGPQKGASEGDVGQLDQFLSNLSEQFRDLTGRNMAGIISGGAAGGAAGGLYAVLNADLRTGIDYFMELTRFEQALVGADLLITGEGSLDSQTMGGKGPYGVARKAKEIGIPTVAIAGKVPLVTDKIMSETFDVLLATVNEPMSLDQALDISYKNLVRTGKMLGDLLYLSFSWKG